MITERYIFAGNIQRLSLVRPPSVRQAKRVSDVLIDGQRVQVLYEDGTRARFTRTDKLILVVER